jgi:hypothetical protein
MRLRLHPRFLTSFSHVKIGIGIAIAIGSPQLDCASRYDPDTELPSLPPFIHQLTAAKPVIGYNPGGLDFSSNPHNLTCGLASFSG